MSRSSKEQLPCLPPQRQMSGLFNLQVYEHESLCICS